VDPARTGLLLSPVEFREWLDEINSPWVGACLDVGHVHTLGCPQDWINTLAGHLTHVRATDRRSAETCLPGEGEVDYAGVMQALRQVGYDGPLSCDGPGQAEQIARQLKTLLTL
jgi:hexulose-6-phosphate isomerase